MHSHFSRPATPLCGAHSNCVYASKRRCLDCLGAYILCLIEFLDGLFLCVCLCLCARAATACGAFVVAAQCSARAVEWYTLIYVRRARCAGCTNLARDRGVNRSTISNHGFFLPKTERVGLNSESTQRKPEVHISSSTTLVEGKFRIMATLCFNAY